MDSLSRLTIVIPTFGRPDFLRRQIAYWQDSAVRIVIADGDSTSTFKEDGLDSPSLTYLRLGGDFHGRMLRLADEVNTEFVAVLGDDDFFSQDGLRACLRRLDSDNSVIGCVGRSIRFFYQDGRILAEQRDPESKEFPREVTSGVERLFATYHPGKIGALFYGVYRSEVWKPVVKAAYSRKYSTGYIYDTIIRTLLTYRGAVGVEESVTWFCSAENPPVKSAPGMNRQVDLLEWLVDPRFRTEVEECQQFLIHELSRLNLSTTTELAVAVHFVFDELRCRYEQKARNNTRLGRRFVAYAKRVFPRPIKRLVKTWAPKRFRAQIDWTFQDLGIVGKQLESVGISVSREDLDRIAQSVLKFHS